jgi:Notch-like protein
VCNANVLPSAEVCDALDNDCDGVVNDGNPGGGAACNTGQQGVCGPGTTACTAGMLACNANAGPSADVCDGLDNDCDGSSDENNPGGGVGCSTGLPGVCGPGTTSCTGGMIVCNQTTASSAEACDNVDNDCDAQTDEGDPGGGGACNTGAPGICGPGTLHCAGGTLQCQPNAVAGIEICGDGLDNDCDGTIDNGCCAHDICVTGVALVNGCHPCVSSICGVDPFCCATSWDSICVGEVSSVCGLAC